MKIMLMDSSKLVNLLLPSEVFGNYWVVNSDKENLVAIEAQDGEWVLKSNSDVKVFRNGNPLTEVRLEYEKFYTLKNVLENKSYVIYISPIYDPTAIQLNISLSDVSSADLTTYIGSGTMSFLVHCTNKIPFSLTTSTSIGSNRCCSSLMALRIVFLFSGSSVTSFTIQTISIRLFLPDSSFPVNTDTVSCKDLRLL